MTAAATTAVVLYTYTYESCLHSYSSSSSLTVGGSSLGVCAGACACVRAERARVCARVRAERAERACVRAERASHTERAAKRHALPSYRIGQSISRAIICLFFISCSPLSFFSIHLAFLFFILSRKSLLPRPAALF